MSSRRVVVTGLGLVTPHGDRPEEIFDRVYAGKPAIARTRSGWGPAETDVLLARASWDPEEHISRRQSVTMDPVAQMAFVSAKGALTQAGLTEAPEILSRAGVYMGCSFGGAEAQEEGSVAHYVRGTRRMRPTAVPRAMVNAPAAQVSMGFGIHGPSHTFSVACTSSAAAIGEAYRAVRDGYLECVVAGGAEAMLSGVVVAAWEAMGVLATEHPDGPAASLRPFDRARTGFVLGEGAGVLVLESEEAARARDATPLGEIVGYGASSDAHELTQPSAEGQARAMEAALAEASVPPEAVGHVNAHATGTPTGDVVEIQAIKEVFGRHASEVAVSATKSMHGHLVGAAGAVELILTLLALRQGRVPPTANLTDPDPECDLDCVPMEGREAPGLEYALSNSFGFGGSNVALLVKRPAG